MLLSLLPLPIQGSFGLSVLCWGKVLVSRGLVWRKGRAAGSFMGVLISPTGDEGDQGHCLPDFRAPLCPQLGLQGSGRQGCPPASAAGGLRGSGFQGIAREAVQSQGFCKRKWQGTGLRLAWQGHPPTRFRSPGAPRLQASCKEPR